MGVKEINKTESKKTDGGGIIDDLAAGVKWNLRMIAIGLYIASK